MPVTCDLDGWNREHSRYRRNLERLVAMKLQPRSVLNNVAEWQRIAGFVLKREVPVWLGGLDVAEMQQVNEKIESYFGLEVKA